MSALPQREFGKTGLMVSALGFGAGVIGDASIPEKQAEEVFNRALDLGVTLIDTARGYGLSEERIGKYLARRRDEFVLSTKVGYGIPGHEDWTAACITAGVDAALARMRTDRLDIVHLHSCPVETLRRGDVIEALVRARESGKIRAAAYSGENEHLEFALQSGRFQSIETSVNICDQRGIDLYLPQAAKAGMGVIAKRPVANAPWRFAERPAGNYAEEYWHRWKTMNVDPRGLDWQEIAMRFAAFAPGVHTAIAGTTNAAHLERNAEHVRKGPLPEDLVRALRDAFKQHDRDWRGQV